jgi:2-polyprenyl-3-methyl-5-hydroxy-6-metoxy-1,4-benzoquinol methylase
MSLDAGAALRPSAAEAIDAWSALVSTALDQEARVTEQVDVEGEAFWQARAPGFRPGVSESEELDYVLSLAHAGDSWMDIGAGAGRLAIPLAGVVQRVVTVDTSPTMRAALEEAAAAAGVTVEPHDARWPEDAGALPAVDVTLAANMLYATPDPERFIEAMEQHSRARCVVALADRPPRTPDPEVWAELNGEPLAVLPGAREFIGLLSALGRRFDVATFAAPEPMPVPVDRAVAQHWRFGLHDGSPRLGRLREILERRAGADKLVRLHGGRGYVAVVSWRPPERAVRR